MLFRPLRDYYDKVYVVTFEGAVERQASARQQLGEGNFEFVFGFDKSKVTKQELTDRGLYDEAGAIRLDRSGRKMSLGEVCCSLSHAAVYQKILDDGCERALIFEDDVVVLPIATHLVEEMVTSAPSDAELVYWGWAIEGNRPWYGAIKQGLYHIQHSLGLLKYDHTMISNLYARPHNEYFDVAGKHLLAHAYAVSRSGAEKMLELNTPVVLNADNVLHFAVLMGKLRAFRTKVCLFDQRSLDPNDPLPTLTST